MGFWAVLAVMNDCLSGQAVEWTILFPAIFVLAAATSVRKSSKRRPKEAEAIKKDFRKALNDTGVVVPMATTNLFGDPIFKDGAFTSNDPKVDAVFLSVLKQPLELFKKKE